MTESENCILSQSVNDDDLKQVSGGGAAAIQNGSPQQDSDTVDCVNVAHRDIQRGKFPNCAATVEEDSWCGTNDACFIDAVVYTNMKNCTKVYQ